MAEKDISARLRRAVKENNLFLVKRLIQRTDLRNPDPGFRRYTSLAWAAVLGHVETFEFLLNSGHDDEELSKDADGNTILLLLAEVQKPVSDPYSGQYQNPDIMAATLSMARSYCKQYPFIRDWSNVQGKTALHVAALKGNEGLVKMLCDDMDADCDLPDNLGNTPLHYASAWNHIQVIQLLIERGCQYNARNHDGFTASDYAYSHSTMHVLQDTAMMQVKSKKGSKRPPKSHQYGAEIDDWLASATSTRLRSGSGGSRTTATSDSGELGYSPMVLSQQSSSFSSSSSQQQQQQQHLMSSTSTTGSSSRLQAPQYGSPSLSHSSSFTMVSPHIPSSSSTTISNSTSSFNFPGNAAAVITSRMRERDADAIAEYKKRNRSGSAGTQYSADSKIQQSAGGSIGTIGSNGSMSTLPTINGSNSHLPLAGISSNPPPTLATRRLLRPSASAAQLRSSPPLPIVTNINSDSQSPGNVSRVRAGTQPTTTRPGQAQSQSQGNIVTSPTESLFSGVARASVERGSSARRADTVPNPSNNIIAGRRPSDTTQGDFTGPPSDYAIFPDPPSKATVGVDSPTPPPPPSATTKPTANLKRAGFALLTKPLPSIDSRSSRDRDHRRGGSASEVRS